MCKMLLCLLLCLCSYTYAASAYDPLRLEFTKPKFTWQSSGCSCPAGSVGCIAISEPALSGWSDNCLLSTNVDLSGWKYTFSGQTWSGMRWVHVNEPDDANWVDNYIYTPVGGEWGYIFYNNGVVPGLPVTQCVRMSETTTSWNDNYFCWYSLKALSYVIPASTTHVGSFNVGQTMYNFYASTLIYYTVSKLGEGTLNGPYALPNIRTNGYASVALGNGGANRIVYTDPYGARTYYTVLQGVADWAIPVKYYFPFNVPFEAEDMGQGNTVFFTAGIGQLVATYSASGYTSFGYPTSIIGVPSCYVTTRSFYADDGMCVYSTGSTVNYISVNCGYRGQQGSSYIWNCTFGSGGVVASAYQPYNVRAVGTNKEYIVTYQSDGYLHAIGSNATYIPSPAHVDSSTLYPTAIRTYTVGKDAAVGGPVPGLYSMNLYTVGSTVVFRCRVHTDTANSLTCSKKSVKAARGNYLMYMSNPPPGTCTGCGSVSVQQAAINSMPYYVSSLLGGNVKGTVIVGPVTTGTSLSSARATWAQLKTAVPQPAYPNFAASDLANNPAYMCTQMFQYLKTVAHGKHHTYARIDNGYTITDVYSSSMAYHVSIAGYYLLNLHESLVPAGTFIDSGQAATTLDERIVASYKSTNYNMISSTRWLTRHLDRASKNRIRVIINMHTYPTAGEWNATDFNALLASHSKAVAAVFTHKENAIGEYGKIPNTQIPIIFVGSSSYRKYMVVRLAKDEFETIPVAHDDNSLNLVDPNPTGYIGTYHLQPM